jgi:hypothetical protein
VSVPPPLCFNGSHACLSLHMLTDMLAWLRHHSQADEHVALLEASCQPLATSQESCCDGRGS